MCKIIIRYTSNNIFLTVQLNKYKIYSKSTGQFLEYKKGKRKVSNLALLVLLNDFNNFFFFNLKKKQFMFILIEIFGCTLKRFFFLKNNLTILIAKFKFKHLIFIDKTFISFNGCRLKKKKKKRNRLKKVKLR